LIFDTDEHPASVNEILYFFVGSILEERKLLLQYGEKYQEYQKKVSMFFPYKWLKAMIVEALSS